MYKLSAKRDVFCWLASARQHCNRNRETLETRPTSAACSTQKLPENSSVDLLACCKQSSDHSRLPRPAVQLQNPHPFFLKRLYSAGHYRLGHVSVVCGTLALLFSKEGNLRDQSTLLPFTILPSDGMKGFQRTTGEEQEEIEKTSGFARRKPPHKMAPSGHCLAASKRNK